MIDAANPVAVLGSGTMGSQIALLAAMAGYDVRFGGRSQERLDAAMASNRALLTKRVEKGRLDAAEAGATLARISTHTTVADAVAGARLVIESVAEEQETKHRVLCEVGAAAAPDAVIATNSSTLPSSRFTGCVPDEGRLLNMHFFNPPTVMQLVEVVRGEHTREDVVQRCVDVARDLGRVPVIVDRESFGFIANRMLFGALQEAFRLVEEGHVSIEDCDVAVQRALGWPLGPFELADLVGLDVTEAIVREGWEQTGDESWKPGPLLTEHVARGELGRKTGRGFREYGSRARG